MSKNMTLKELKNIVDATIEHLHFQNPEEITVRITLSETSMGARASSGVKYAGKGIDWENGQFRIEPLEQLVRRGNSLTDVRGVICRQYEGRNYYFCPKCSQKISKNDCYCRDCSQRLK